MSEVIILLNIINAIINAMLFKLYDVFNMEIKEFIFRFVVWVIATLSFIIITLIFLKGYQSNIDELNRALEGLGYITLSVLK